VNAFAPAAAQSLMPALVPRPDLPKAVAFSSLAFSSGSIIGPVLAGAAIAAGQHFGTGGAEAGYAAAAVFYGLALLCLLAVRAPKREPLTEARSLAMIGEGLAYVWRNKVVLGAMSLDLVAVLLAGATALLPVFARDLLDTGAVPPEVALGWMRSAVALGAALTALVLTTAPLTRRVGPWMFGSVGVFGLATVGFGLADNLWPALAALLIIGASDMVSVNVRSSLIQLATPDPMRGRVASIGFIFISASNELGDFQSGLAARLLGPVGAVLFGGVGALATTVIWIKLFPELWALDSFEDAARLADTARPLDTLAPGQ
jgi:MFS family permease